MLLLSIIFVSKKYNIIIINNTWRSLKLFLLISSFKVFNHLKVWFSQTFFLIPSLKKLWAEAFTNDNLPGYDIKSVAGDGMCILHLFVEGLQRIDNKFTLSEAKSSLRGELISNHAYYKDFSPDKISILDELQLFLYSPMEYYNINNVHLFFYTLFNTFTAKEFSETRPFMHLSKHVFGSQ